ncbi:MAG: hypothetical protein QOE51_1757 [Actinoplanes sp.]|nr:hypothetical protein [Actinoplanes sp.]
MVARRGRMIVAGGLLAFCVGWLVIGLFHVWSAPVGGWLPLPVMCLLAVYTCGEVTRRRDLPVPTRRFWGWVAISCLDMTAAALSNAWDALGSGIPSQRISLLTVALYLAANCQVMWALLRLPSWQRSRADWIRFSLDSGIVLISTGLALWHFSLRRMDLWASQTGSALSILAIVVVTSVSMVTFVKAAFGDGGRIDRRALHLLSISTAVSAASGGAAPLLIAHRPYLSATLLAVPIAVFGVQLAAFWQLGAKAQPLAAPARTRRSSLAPYLAIAGIDALLVGSTLHRGAENELIATGVVVISALVVARQVAALVDNGRLLRTVDANLTQLRDYQRQLDHQVTHDALTGIANRARFEQRITERLADGDSFHVALLDLDDFKEVNDRLGHGVGDGLLKAISRRLCEHVRDGDLVARLGGDEFALLLAAPSGADADTLLIRMAAAVHRPLLIEGHDLLPRISLGVTGSQPGDTPGELLRRADVAMYSAKTAGGGRRASFDPVMDRIADGEARLGSDLRQAVARDELFVLYQPIVELPSGALAGVEALVRWRHPEHGLISPDVFIPLAEHNGTIVAIGRWILEQVFTQVKAWQLDLGPRTPGTTSVNISARQLREPGFVAEVAALLAENDLDPALLTVEVTETAVFGTGAALDAVRQLHALGLQVALDDFGTGQSSLSLLVSAPVDVLKVDKSFVDGVTLASTQAVIVEGLIGITQGLRIQAVAEGVKTAEQAERLHQIGYRYAQGFHFARPMTAGDVAGLLERTPAGQF